MKYNISEMQTNDYKKLKSGTDVRGVAIAAHNVTGNAYLSEDAAYDIASAFVFWLNKKLGKNGMSLAVGHDSRITADCLLGAIVRAFLDSSCKVHNCGLITTPAMFMMTKFENTDCDGVIMITASHHPFQMNGMKFFTKEGGIGSKELVEILDYAEKKERIAGSNGRELISDYTALYVDLLKSQIRKFSNIGDMPLKGMKIVVDAGNGAAGFFASRVLAPLGADTSGSQFLEPDGYFPNHVPNPEDKIAMQSMRDCVIRNGADLGIIFDTDGDRVGIVTADGNEINRNRLIAAATALLLECAENKGAYIVTDSVTSEGLRQFIEDKGGIHLRYRRGYKNVIDKAAELCKEGKNAPLAIETSGHAAFRENYFLDDGAYLAVRLIAKAVELKGKGSSLSELISSLKEPVESIEVRLNLTGENWKKDAEVIIFELQEYSKKHFIPAADNYEGIRAVVTDDKGWFLLRLSVHDPVMPLNIESDIKGGATSIAAKLLAFFTKYDMLDFSQLKGKC